MQYAFGAGNFYVTPLNDANGNAIANPTPMNLMTLQEGSMDFSGELKMLYGQNQYAVAVGRGKVKSDIKVKPARIFAAVWNTIFFGQYSTLTKPFLLANFTDTTGTAIPTTPFTITPVTTYTAQLPTGAVFVADLGVFNATTGYPMTRVASAPTTGQYSVAAGVYTFAAADTGNTVYINFQYSATSVTQASKLAVKNLPMGYAPSFAADLTVAYQGKLVTFHFPNAISTKMGLTFKNDDFTIPEFDFSAFDDGAGNIMTWSTSE